MRFFQGMRKVSRSCYIVLFVLIVTMVPALYGNVVTKRGGLLDDSLLNKEDPSYCMDKRAESFMAQQLKTSDVITLVVNFNPHVTVENLRFIQTLTNDLKAAFPEYAILSLSVVPKYRDTGEELLNRPYIDDQRLDEIAADGAKLPEWCQEVAADHAACGMLIGRDFDYAAVNILLPRGFDEIATFRRVAEFLEQRKIPWYEWLIKTDVYPAEKFANITLAGWAAARGLMDAALNADVMKLISLGLILVGVFFYFSLRSKMQAVIAVTIIVICFLWTRGTVGLLQTMGFEIYERVYILLVYTTIIVSGISFVERKFECYNEVRAELPGLTPKQSWDRTTKVVNGVIWITALNAIANFGTLYQIGIRGILEVGLLSALSIVYLLILVLWFLPALHALTGGEANGRPSSRAEAIADGWNRFLQQVVVRCHRFLDPSDQAPFRYNRKAIFACSTTFGLLFVAVLLLASDYVPAVKKDFRFLHVRTRPMDYLPDTIVYRASQILNRDGNYGFDRLTVLVQPKDGRDIYDCEFVARVDDLKAEIARIHDVREVGSVMDMVNIISRESYKTPLPQNRSEIHDSLRLIQWDLGLLIKEQLWFEKGVILLASMAAEDSNKTGDIVTNIVKLGQDRFPDLDIVPFGNFVTYPQSDRYIREGKPWNVVNSQWIVVVICALWILWRQRSSARSARHSVALRPWWTGAAITIPFMFSSAVIIFVMILLRIPLDQATACITALTVNAAIDFSLYMVADYQSAILTGRDLRESLRYALLIKGKIIVIDIVLNSICFAPLMLSRFIPVARMGWIMIIMLLSCGFGSLVLLAAVLPWCVKKT